MPLVPSAIVELTLGLPPRVVVAALARMVASPEPPAPFRRRETLAGEEGEGGLRLRMIPALGSLALFEARAEVEPSGVGARVRLRIAPRQGATSFFWTLGAAIMAAGAVLLAFGHLAGAVTLTLPLLAWWGRFLAESAAIARAVGALDGRPGTHRR
jgi:hypothetical protein